MKFSDMINLNTSPKSENIEEKCEIQDIWGILGKRWSLLILKNLSKGHVVRFNELKRNLKGISSTVLSERLSELEQEGLVVKKIYAEVPLRVEYTLTSKTKDLEPILRSLSGWCDKWEEKKNI
ncbi:MAG: winged helix-turn-helix transcriptional regulator [Nitrososphaeraceae archaeon]